MVLERTYIIPLRKEWLKAPKHKRAKKAITAIKQFLARHMKSEDVRVLKELNLEIWKHGIKNPPSRIKISAAKDDKGVIRVNLFGKSTAEEKKVEEKPKPTSKLAQAVEKMKGKPAKPKKEKKAKKETELEKKIKVKEVPKETKVKKEQPKEEKKVEEPKEEKPKEVKPEVKKEEAPKTETKPVEIEPKKE